MDAGTGPKPADKGQRRGAKSRKTERLTIHEDRLVEAVVPSGSRFKGYQVFVVQDLAVRPHVTRIRRER
jgi:hypothetical protein